MNDGNGNNTTTGGVDRSRRSLNYEALRTHVVSHKIDVALWVIRIFTVLFTLAYFIPIVGNSHSSYYKALLSNAAISALRLHQRLGTVQFTQQFIAQLLTEDSCHYLFYSLIFIYVSPIALDTAVDTGNSCINLEMEDAMQHEDADGDTVQFVDINSILFSYQSESDSLLQVLPDDVEIDFNENIDAEAALDSLACQKIYRSSFLKFKLFGIYCVEEHLLLILFGSGVEVCTVYDHLAINHNSIKNLSHENIMNCEILAYLENKKKETSIFKQNYPIVKSMFIMYKFVGDGVFKAELNEFLTRELAEDGYSGVEVRVTPTRTEIIIMATRTQNVLGEKGRRIRELTSVVQKRFHFGEGSVELYAEKVATRGLCAIAQAESLRYKLIGGLAVRRACYGVLRFIMESGAKGCEVVVSGKLRGQRAKSMKFVDGLMIHPGDPCNDYVDTATRHVLLRQGVLGIKVKIMLPWDPNGKMGPKRPLPDNVSVVEPKEEVLPQQPSSDIRTAKPDIQPTPMSITLIVILFTFLTVFLAFVRKKSIIYILHEIKFEIVYNVLGVFAMLDDWMLREKDVAPGCRNVKAGENLFTQIRNVGIINGNMDVYELDLNSFASIRQFAKNVKEKFSKVHILINNAGKMFGPYEISEDGYESQFATNYLGHFLLTHLLLPQIIEAGKSGTYARIVNVSSCAHTVGTISFQDINLLEQYIPSRAYAQSKLAQILFTNHLNTLMKDTNKCVAFYSVHPGIVNTDLFKHWYIKKAFGSHILGFFFKTTKQGATSIVYTCLSTKMEIATGTYISNCQIVPMSALAYSTDLQHKLFDFTKNLLNIKQFGVE
ncbi:hypothetical protein FQA39_LY13379 [Lamprigera yunnana]|nr:hypothetical protein FQA39_LY13379 [Lamprigera yunnana]